MTGTRNTLQKQLVSAAVRELDKHATAEQVYEHVALTHPTVSKATVYRNLHLAAKTGELADIGAYDGVTHFDHRTHEHSHFMCEHCKQVFDVKGDFSDVLNRAKVSNGASIYSYQLSFTGACANCANKSV